MELSEFLEHLNQGLEVIGGSEIHQYMFEVSQEALRTTAELNNAYHTPEEIRILMSKLIGKLIDESFTMFSPFYTDCGKNITIGKNVFINSGQYNNRRDACIHLIQQKKTKRHSAL